MHRRSLRRPRVPRRPLLPEASGPGPSGSRGPLLLLAILTIGLGIVAMHMLSVGHHAAGSDSGSHQAVTDQVGQHAPMGAAQATPTRLAPSSPTAVLLECGPDCQDDSGLTGAACMVALALLIFVRRPRQVGDRVPAPLLDPSMLRLLVHGVRTRAPRPPSLTALGISRT